MSFVRDPLLSVRENLVRYWLDQLLTVQPGSPPEGYSLSWHVVQRAPFDSGKTQYESGVALLEGRESLTEDTNYTVTCRLSLGVEFFLKTMLGDTPMTLANQALTDLRRLFSADRQSGGLGLNLIEVGNELTVDTAADKLVEGALAVDLIYRHRRGDPRKLIGE